MISAEYIEANKTETLKKGDKVVMHSCMEGKIPENNGKVWTCFTDSYSTGSKLMHELVFLEGFSGAFNVNFLQKVNVH